MKGLYIPKNKQKNNQYSRENTPLSISTNKSNDEYLFQKGFSSLKILKNKIKKRNTRTNSLCYSNTENSYGKFKVSDKSGGISKIIEKSPSYKQFPFHQMIQSLTNLSFTKSGTKKSSKSQNFTKGMIPHRNSVYSTYESSSSQLRQNSCLLTSSNFQSNIPISINENSLCDLNLNTIQGSVISSDTRQKLESIYNELSLILKSSNKEQVNIIYKEIEKLFTSINNDFYDSQLEEIDKIKEDNKALNKINSELLKKVEIIEKKCDEKILENRKILEDCQQMRIVINEMTNKIELLRKGFEIIKSENSQRSFQHEKDVPNGLERITKEENSNRVGDDFEDTDNGSINLSLADNINIDNNNNPNINNNVNYKIGKLNNKLNLNFKKVSDFNNEFLENYDEFSPSWRKEADKMLARKKKK